MNDQNWRTDVSPGDYFLHQQKRVALESRRPVIRRASDLVGPGIAGSAVRLDDFNNLLGTFNGFYSSLPGAANAPNSTEAFVGIVVSDSVLGGRQVFTGMTSGIEYNRLFTRSPTSPETIGWAPWSGVRIPPTAQGYAKTNFAAASGFSLVLPPPTLSIIGGSGTYERSDAGIRIRKQGVYTGSIQVGSNDANLLADVALYRPDGATTTAITDIAVPLNGTHHIPFTCWATDGEQGFTVILTHFAGVSRTVWWRFSCTRVGDAV